MSVWLGFAFAASDIPREPLTNDDVVRLVKAGFAEGIVLHAVEMNHGKYDLAPDAVANLRKAGVSEKVVAAMLTTRAKSPPHLRLLDPGVYFTRADAYALVEAETVTWHSIANAVDVPGTRFERLTLVGRVQEPTSRLPLSRTAELLIVCEPNRRASDYRLLRAEAGDEWREFIGEAALQGERLLGFASPQVLPLVLDDTFDLGARVKLGGLRKGEYGLVPPDFFSAGRAATQGKIYTFSIE